MCLPVGLLSEEGLLFLREKKVRLLMLMRSFALWEKVIFANRKKMREGG